MREQSMYGMIVADPAWTFDDKIGRRGTDKVYTKSNAPEEILALGPLVQAVAAPDCVLALWFVASQAQAGLDVMAAWGFDQKQIWTWRKLTVHGKQHIGMGRLARATKECVLIGTRGKPKPIDKSIRDEITAHMPTWKRDAIEGADWPDGRYAHLIDAKGGKRRGPYIHSAKPEQLQDNLELMFPDAMGLELFARRSRSGWTCLGNECPGDGRDLNISLAALLPQDELDPRQRRG